MGARLFSRLLLFLYLILGVGYSVLVPMWEAADEPAHYQRVLNIARADSEAISKTYEEHQPPLYYWLASWPIRALDRLDSRLVSPSVPKRRPWQSFPPVFDWNDATYRFRLGPQLLRWLNLALGALALQLILRTCRMLVPRSEATPLAVLALTGLSPQFLHVTTAINNDALAILAGALLFHQLVVTCSTSVGPRQSLTAFTLACLLPVTTKLSVLPLALAVLLALIWKLRGRPSRLLEAASAAVLAMAVCVVVMPTATTFAYHGLVARALHLRPDALDTLPVAAKLLSVSYWGVLGWLGFWRPYPAPGAGRYDFTLGFPQFDGTDLQTALPFEICVGLTSAAALGVVLSLRLLYPRDSVVRYLAHPSLVALAVAITIAAMVIDSSLLSLWVLATFACAHRVLSKPSRVEVAERSQMAFVWVAAGLAFLAVVKNFLATPEPQGRFLFPAIGPLSFLSICGWACLAHPAWLRCLPYVVTCTMLALNAVMYWRVVLPIYYQPLLD